MSYDMISRDRSKEIDEILDNLLEPCEIVLDVVFHGRDTTRNYVVVLDRSTLKYLQGSSKSCKTVLQKDLIRKGITEVPIYEFGSNSHKKLLRCKTFKLKEEDPKSIKRIMRESRRDEE